MKYILVSLIAIFASTQVAQAIPQIHPDLNDYLSNPAMSNSHKAVILVFKDKAPLPSKKYSPLERAETERLMIRNAQLSQEKTLFQILEYRNQGVACETKEYWLTNSLGVYTTQKILKQLIQSEDIVAVYPNRVFKLNLPYYHGDAPLRGDDFTYGLKKLKIPELRAKKTDLDGRGVKVGILDTGIDAQHPDLKDKVLLFKDHVSNKQTPYDDHGHGTHVAGTVGGGKSSGTSIGVAPGVKFIISKIFNASGSASEAKILEAMQWIADPDGNPSTNDAPALVSNSWGGGMPSASMDPQNEPECRAVDAWVKLGIAPIFAAGNSGSSPKTVNIPGACPAAIAVGATDENDAIASFSSRGAAVWKTGTLIKPHVSAPGVKTYSSMPGGKYGSMSGTSMATPHTSGLAALVYQIKPDTDVTTLAKLLAEGAQDLGAKGNDNDYGFGRIDAINTLKVLYTEGGN